METIWVVEDEAHLAEGLQFNLEAEGYEVEVFADGEIACERLAANESIPDLVVLDVMLPSMNGFEVARRARGRRHPPFRDQAVIYLLDVRSAPGERGFVAFAHRHRPPGIARRARAVGNYVPILMLTAKDAAEDRVRGIAEGADDYLTKPFRLDELLARVRGLLRRRRWDGGGEERETCREVSFGDVTVHFDRFEVVTQDATERITTREAGLLRALVEREGEAITRGELLEQVWGLRPDTKTRVVDSFIVRLRRYVERDPASPRHIVAVRGHGYKFVR